MLRAVEIRSDTIRPEARDASRRLMSGSTVSMVSRRHVDMVAHGPSRHDADARDLIRGDRDPAVRPSGQDALCGSEESRNGPREPILSLIHAHAWIVRMPGDPAVAALRR